MRRRYIPEAALHAWGTPRPLFLLLLGVLSAGASTMAAYAHLNGLYATSAVSGLAFGA